MSVPITIEPRCTIKGWHGDHKISVKVSTGRASAVYLIDIEDAGKRYPHVSQMEAVKKVALDRFREPDPLSFNGYD